MSGVDGDMRSDVLGEQGIDEPARVVLEFFGPSLRSEVAEERARAASTKRNPAPHGERNN